MHLFCKVKRKKRMTEHTNILTGLNLCEVDRKAKSVTMRRAMTIKTTRQSNKTYRVHRNVSAGLSSLGAVVFRQRRFFSMENMPGRIAS